MTLDTVLTTWFEPGTISKIRTERSPRGRIYQGAKGIGRFASARLGELPIPRKSHQSKSVGVTVLFDWGAFDDESFLDEVEVAWEERRSLDLRRGTRLTLDGLRKHWTEDDYRELHSRLSRLISPFKEVTDFVIELHIPGHPELVWQRSSTKYFLAHPRYQLTGTVDHEGLLRWDTEVRRRCRQAV